MILILFPGQGSQIPGMGRKLYSERPETKLVFEEIEEALGFDLRDVMFNGTSAEIMKTTCAQPAIFAVSMAIWRIMIAECGDGFWTGIQFMAGHSLGEYSALCASGAISLFDTAKLLTFRAQFMKEAAAEFGPDYSMVALLGTEVLRDDLPFCNEAGNNFFSLANDNGGGQFVFSCSNKMAAKMIDNPKDFGGKKAITIPVEVPCHCILLNSVADRLLPIIKSCVKWRMIHYNVIANSTARPYVITDDDECNKTLARQVCDVVRWSDTIKYCYDAGSTAVLEVGPGAVLTNIIRRAGGDLRAVAANEQLITDDGTMREVGNIFQDHYFRFV